MDKVTTTLLHFKERNPEYYKRLIEEYGKEGLTEKIETWDEFIEDLKEDR